MSYTEIQTPIVAEPGLPVIVDVAREPCHYYVGRRLRMFERQRLNYTIAHRPAWLQNPRGKWKWRTQELANLEYEHLWKRRLSGRARHQWRERLLALRGKRIGCWTAVGRCEAHVLVDVLTELLNGACHEGD